MLDYRQIIDQLTWDFINRTTSFYPEDTADRSISEQRAIYDAMCTAFHAGIPAGVSSIDRTIGAVPVRQYLTDGGSDHATVLYMHGGGSVVGGLESHDDVCAEICAETGLPVVSVDYRLSPEHVHPAAFEDCQSVLDSLDGDIVLCGDSAGGCLAAMLAHANRDPAILGQVLLYPGLGGDVNSGSYLRHAHAPMLTRDEVLFYREVSSNSTQDDPKVNPLADKDFFGLPPTLVISAECDPLADDPRHYRDRIQAAGGQAIHVEETGLVHGFLRARHSVPRAARSFSRVTHAITGIAEGKALYEIDLL